MSELPDGTGLIRHDSWLAPYADRLRDRYAHYAWMRSVIGETGGLMGPMSLGYNHFGLNRGEHEGRPGVWYREWAPGAKYLALIGDFNAWDRGANPLQRDEWGVWHLFLPDEEYASRLTHGSRVMVHVFNPDFGAFDRIPAYIRRVVQDATSQHFTGQFWDPPEPYAWKNDVPVRHGGLRVYEAHVGMATEEGRVGTYVEFARNVLPRAARLGYNAVQLMAVMEHPYYGSFGYHVSNFFAPSSRFGTPEELKALIDAAHGLGLRVIMDIVHSHAVKNLHEGLNHFDGTDYQYFHSGGRGQHPAWDSLLFDYARPEVQRFLLSNVRYWIEEFRFDGLRFDGVTSMVYHDHGLGAAFSSYDSYFGGNADKDAVGYLMLANELMHQIQPGSISVAEDVSGMPGMARPVSEGGLGFDYRLAMGLPDYWIKLLKEKSDEQWDLGGIYSTLLNRRHSEKHIGYAESHDQALVGDKTLAFWLMDADMYWNMGVDRQSLIIDRGVALHKIIRLLTFTLGGEGYLTFMGNEFGHPEWIDFPREGNNYSYHYARRQWSLAERDDLRYKGLEHFDAAMMHLDERYNVLEDPFIEQLAIHQDTRQMVYRRGPFVIAVNLHATESYVGLRIPVPDRADYRVLLNSDDREFGGHGFVEPDTVYPIQDVPMYGRDQSLQIYLPSRSAQVLAPTTLIR